MTIQRPSSVRPALLLTVFLAAMILGPWGTVFTRPGDNRIEVRVAALRNFPPHYSLDDHGRPAGFAIDVMDKIAPPAGLAVQYVVCDTWSEVMEGLAAGEIDIIPNLGVTEERQAELAFTAPYETFNTVIFVRSSTGDIHGQRDLEGRRVAAVRTNVALSALRSHGLDPVVYEKPETALFALLSGEVDAVVYPEPIFLRLAWQSGLSDRIKAVGPPLTEVKRAMAAPRSRQDLRARLDLAVSDFLASPEYGAVYGKWFGQAQPFWTAYRVFLLMSLILVVLVILSLLWLYRHQLRSNRELRWILEVRRMDAQRLQEMRDILASLVDHIDAIVWVYSYQERRLVYVSQAYERIVQRSLEYAIREPLDFCEAAHPADRDRVEQTLFPFLIRNEPTEFDIEFRIIRPDGSICWLRDRAFPSYDSDGRIHQLIGLAEDITRHKDQQERLDRARQTQEQILNNLEDAVFLVRPEDRRILLCNRAVERVFGYRPDELVGESTEILYRDRASFEELGRLIYPVLGMKGISRTEWEMKRCDGRPIQTEITVSEISGDQGWTGGVLCVIRDVTRLRETEEQRRLLAAAVEQAHDSVAITDSEGRIQYANRRYVEMLGVKDEEVPGTRPPVFRADFLSPERAAQMWREVREGRSWVSRLDWRDRTGKEYVEDVSVLPIRNSRDDVTHLLVMKHDVTQQVRVERDLQHSRKMEAVGQLAGGIAHDFNNLLQAILGYADLAIQGLSADQDLYEDLRQIYNSAEKATQLTRQLLVFGRRQTLRPRYLDLAGLVLEFAGMIRRLIQEHIEVRVQANPDAGTIHADPGQIEQILMNLCVNSRDAMPAGGTITITVEPFFIDESHGEICPGSEPGPHVRLSVADTGEGIPPDLKERIFEPFFTTKPE
ncbi:PAS domain S-box protein, partial [bacterium]|nr:PAS domain S-box protein [bacterium]